MGSRRGVRCTACGSLERTRSIKLLLDTMGLPKRGARVLHLAPEAGLASWLRSVSPKGYDPVDLYPSLYKQMAVRKFDLVTDSPKLPDDHYDLILHSHVMEHIPCTLAFPFYHLSRALKPDGVHVFCVPLMDGSYDEDLGPLSAEDAIRRFGQRDHVRRFGKSDIERHLGMVMRLDTDFSLYRLFDAATLDRHNIPESQRTGLHGSTIFIARKSDYRLGLLGGRAPTAAVLVERALRPLRKRLKSIKRTLKPRKKGS